MDIKRAGMMARDLMTHYGLSSWTFGFDSAIRRFGQCRYDKRHISLSAPLTQANSEERVLNSLLHEIAHALAPRRSGHDGIWRSLAISIGCDGKRLYDHTAVAAPKHSYAGVCPSGHTITRHRRRSLSCSRCSPVYNESFLFVWKKI